MNYIVRAMTVAEHSDNTWEAIFGVADEDCRNYCVVYVPSGRVVADLLTFEEAKDEAEECQAYDEFEAECLAIEYGE